MVYPERNLSNSRKPKLWYSLFSMYEESTSSSNNEHFGSPDVLAKKSHDKRNHSLTATGNAGIANVFLTVKGFLEGCILASIIDP